MKINWLPINYCFGQCSRSIISKLFNSKSPGYINDAFKEAGYPIPRPEHTFLKLNQPLQKTNR